MTDQALRYADALQRAKDLNEIEELTARFTKEVGMDIYSFIGFPSDGEAFTVNNYPVPWMDRYAEEHYFDIDPVILSGHSRQLPYTWHELLANTQPSPRQKQFFAEGRNFDIVSGVTIPLRTAQGQFGMMFFSSREEPEKFQKLWAERCYTMHLVGLYVQTLIYERKSPTRAIPEITPRQIEVLLWSARGKTSWETSEIMGISERTVNFHLRQACTALGVSGKQTAVVKAIMLGIIRP